MKRFERVNKIPISWLLTQGYCEYQIQLEHVQSIKSKPTPEMQLGVKRHLELEEEHKQRADLKLSTEEALSKTREEKVTLICRELPVRGKLIYGVIDEVKLDPNQIAIIDDKPSRKAYLSTKKQIWGYCLAFKENFNPEQILVACLRNRDTQEIVWKKTFTPDDENMVQTAIQRIFGILRKSKAAIPTENPNKCMKCRFQDKCDVKKGFK